MIQVTLKDEFVEDVLGMLSGNLVDVELEEEDLELAYRLAKKTWKQKGNDNLNQSFFAIQTEPDKNEYDIPVEVTDINEVIGSSNDFGFVQEDPFAMASFQETFTYGMGGSVSGDYFFIYDMTKQIIDNNKRYLAIEPNYKFNRRAHKLYLYNPPKTPRTLLLDVYRESTDEEYQEHLWILNWTVAECKQILGRAYRKFGSLPSPTGESQIDGDQLVQEAQREKELLLEEIEHFVDGEPDGLGIWIG